MNNIVQSRLAAINEEQRKLRSLQEQAAATRDQALAQLAQYRDLELRLSGAATVLQEVIEAISVAQQSAKEQGALSFIQDKVVEIIDGITGERLSRSDRLGLDPLGMVELAMKLEDAFGINVGVEIGDLSPEDKNKQFNALIPDLTNAQTVNDVVDFVWRNTVSKK